MILLWCDLYCLFWEKNIGFLRNLSVSYFLRFERFSLLFVFQKLTGFVVWQSGAPLIRWCRG
ncbi:hypothetical protein RchiOBHm_Chr1g0325851 [Rosa chinensis]|uniref:Uncharacterized protein n=1 Tax=Rosa chinensis TaxID=74649 RepID=A0A2P6SA63_ROSCH|nr:hypothetical protein RchiOBHm_Chr1g0325851 [Rosa chinensis]